MALEKDVGLGMRLVEVMVFSQIAVFVCILVIEYGIRYVLC